jgi:hypothetical protein
MFLEDRLTRRHCQRQYPSRPLLAHRSRRLQARQSFDVSQKESRFGQDKVDERIRQFPEKSEPTVG